MRITEYSKVSPFQFDEGFVKNPHTVTACKHGSEDCDICGTSRRRDTLHTTRGGVGKVGQLFSKKRK